MNDGRDNFLTGAMGIKIKWWPTYQDHDGTNYVTCRSFDTEEEAVNYYKGRYPVHGAKCGIKPNFSTWDGFGKLWEWAQEQEWYPKFINTIGDYQYNEPAAGLTECAWVDTYIIHPTRFADALYAFLAELEVGK